MISLILFGCQFVSPVRFISPFATPTLQPAAPSKQIVQNTLPFVERWRWSGDINNLSNFPAVVITKDRIVILGRERAEQRIIVFDAYTGKPMWESEIIRSIDSVTADEERVYIGTLFNVQAFDLKTGQKLWQGVEQPSMKRGGLVVYSKKDRVEVYDIYESLVYILNSATGQVIDKIPKLLFFRWNGIDYSVVRGNYFLEARDTNSGKKLWSYAFPGYIDGWPVFTDDTMLLNSRGQIFGIETRTGEIVWQTADTQTTYIHPQYITNAALQDERAYALRYDAAIVGFNPETGEQVGIIKMMPDRTLEDDKGDVIHYAITTSEKFVAVYYGNSQELIVFEKVNDTSK